jgi:hypothetical protein
MAQHLWLEQNVVLSVGRAGVRLCEVCLARQFGLSDDWQPPVGPICPGDPEDGGRRVTRPRPNAPSGAPVRVLEDA